MARKANRKETNAERQAKLAAKFAAGEIEPNNQPELPEGVEVVVLEPTPEGMAIMHRAIAEAVGERPVTEEEDAASLAEAIAEMEETEEEKHDRISVVKDRFKKRYVQNAIESGATHKAAKRSNWDWLAQQIAAFCLDDKGKIDIRAFVALLNQNEVDHSRWTNRNRGWEGRFRMTGRVALQKRVATTGLLFLPGDTGDNGSVTTVEAPAEWCERYLPKV
jgi:hypothetical protein